VTVITITYNEYPVTVNKLSNWLINFTNSTRLLYNAE